MRARWLRFASVGAVAALIALGPGSVGTAQPPSEPVMSWGQYGQGPGEFDWPSGIAIGPGGDVYVADRYNHRIQRFALDGTYIGEWGSNGSGPGQFDEPNAVALDADGNVYVADPRNHRIQRFTADGTFLGAFGEDGWDDEDLQFPLGVAIDHDGSVLVSDTQAIKRFTPEGRFLGLWRGEGNGLSPGGIAVAPLPSSDVFLIRINQGVERYAPDGSRTQWGTYGPEPGQMASQQGVTVGPDGTVYVADTGNHRIQAFTADGGLLWSWGTYGEGDGQLAHPESVAVGPDGHLYVADTRNARIVRVGLAGGPAPSGTPAPSAGTEPIAPASAPPAVTPRPVSTPTPAAGFTEAQQYLLSGLPRAVRRTCEPRTERLAEGTVGAINCAPALPAVEATAYYLLEVEDAVAVWEQRVDENLTAQQQRRAGDCFGDVPGLESSTGGDSFFACYYDDDGQPNLRLVYDSGADGRYDPLVVDGVTVRRPAVYYAVLGRGGVSLPELAEALPRVSWGWVR